MTPTDNPRHRGATGRVRRWTPLDETVRLELPPEGLPLGVDGNGTPVTFPLLVPTHATRVGVVGEVGLARLLALRLLGQACDLVVVTNRTDDWQRLAASVPESPFAVSQQLRRWPLEGTPAPWALIIDMDEPPPTGFSRTPWSTVVHLSPHVPAGSGWWQSAQLVLTTAANAREVATLRPRVDVSAAQRMAFDSVLAIEQTRVRVFQPSLSHHEYSLLTTYPQR